MAPKKDESKEVADMQKPIALKKETSILGLPGNLSGPPSLSKAPSVMQFGKDPPAGKTDEPSVSQSAPPSDAKFAQTMAK